jgi:hypothetical protein
VSTEWYDFGKRILCLACFDRSARTAMRFGMVEAAVSPQIFREYPMLMRYRHCTVAQARLAASSRLLNCLCEVPFWHHR